MQSVPPEVLRPPEPYVAVLADSSTGSMLARALTAANTTATGGFLVGGRQPGQVAASSDRSSRLALSYRAVDLAAFPRPDAIRHVLGHPGPAPSAADAILREDWHVARASLPCAAVAVAILDPSTPPEAWAAARESAVGRWRAAKACLAASDAPVHCVAIWPGGPEPSQRSAREAASKRLAELRSALGPDCPSALLLTAEDLAAAASDGDSPPTSPGPISSRATRLEAALH
ncbi:hypothetical protein FNF28_05319 [Cafeteria roenbergensis]|uniref:Uncharacterized protein n=1 Tax=Cafeteria roenbergensis TaxID=33653 RepID=A0A5A8D6E0_CAFRO|nr:hypothetical protein FNF28_05319 [Cafeteria roenbergensis]